MDRSATSDASSVGLASAGRMIELLEPVLDHHDTGEILLDAQRLHDHEAVFLRRDVETRRPSEDERPAERLAGEDRSRGAEPWLGPRADVDLHDGVLVDVVEPAAAAAPARPGPSADRHLPLPAGVREPL